MSIKKASRRRRILKAVEVILMNAIFWVVIPYYLGVVLSKYAPSSPITVPLFIYEFGILITALEVGAALTEGMALSVPFLSAVSLVTAVYLWLALEGGRLAVTASGVSIVLGFQALLYLIILPSIWGVFKAPISYMIWRRAAKKEGAVPA